MTMHIEHVNPPIPSRDHDYRATLEGYEPGDPQGGGATPEAAREDLEELLDEMPVRSGPDYREAPEYYADEARRKRREWLENGG